MSGFSAPNGINRVEGDGWAPLACADVSRYSGRQMRTVVALLVLVTMVSAEEVGWLQLSGTVKRRVPDKLTMWLDLWNPAGQKRFRFRVQEIPASGVFRFDNLPPGHYDVHIVGSRHADYLETDFRLTASEREFSVSLSLPGIVRGRVEAGPPWRHGEIQVQAFRENGNWLDDLMLLPRAEAEVDGDGNFEMKTAPGRYVFLFRQRPSLVRRKLVTVAEGPQEMKIALARDAAVSFSVELPPGEPYATGALEFPETVRDAWNFYVQQPGIAGQPPLTPGLTAPGRLSSFVRGTKRSLRLVAGGFKTIEDSFTVTDNMTRRFRLQPVPGQYLVVQARAIGLYSATATAMDAPGDRIKLRWETRYSRGEPRARRAVFLPPGRYLLRLESKSYDAEIPVTVGSDRSVRVLPFRKQPLAAVRGTIVSPRGEPLKYGSVSMFRKEGDGFRRLWQKDAVLEDHRFEIKGVTRGRYRFSFTQEGDVILGEVDVGDDDLDVVLRYPAEPAGDG